MIRKIIPFGLLLVGLNSFGQTNADVSIVAASNFAQYDESVGTINVPVTVANANALPINLTFSLSVYSDAQELQDFNWINTIEIPANSNGITNVPLTIIDDLIPEKAERIIVKLSSGSNATISATNNYQIIFIKDNDYTVPSPTNDLTFSLLNSYSNGPSGTNSAEIVTFDPSVNKLFIANSIGGKMDIVDFSNPSNPVAITSISMAPYGGINSLVAHGGIVACAVEAIPAQNNGKVVLFDHNGTFINQVEVGAMPDMITFNKDYTKLLTANEGEPNSTYTNDPEGSISIIDLSQGYMSLSNSNVTTIGFGVYNGQEAALRAQGIRVFSTSNSVAQDFEPEYIAISDDNTKAYVTLQENNALVTIDLLLNSISSLSALGYASYASGSQNALDASDQSGAILITGNLPIKGAYMPDAMVYKTINNTGFLFTANEGDSREFGSVIDANRLSSATFNNLDATQFPDQGILRNNKFLGRLSALKYSGDTDGDGDYDELHVLGSRSFSIWNTETGNLVFDSKDLIEQILANHPNFKTIFNASNTIGIPALKNRSDDKGPEPEGVTVATIDGNTYAFVSLERIGGVMTFNVNNPSNPIYVGYANNRSTSVSGPDLGAEGIIFISATDSPNGKDLLILANEVSSTLSIFQINTCESLSVTNLNASANVICEDDSILIVADIQSNVNIQWMKNGINIQGELNDSLTVKSSGEYSFSYINSDLACAGIIDPVTLTVNPLPQVNAGSDLVTCYGDLVTLTAIGAPQVVWNNNITNGQGFVAESSAQYIVTGTSVDNCVATDTVELTVNALPLINAGSDIVACFGDQVTLTAIGAPQVVWNNSITNGQAFVAESSAQYIVTGTSVDNCVATDTVELTVNALPLINAGSDIVACFGDQVTLTATGAPQVVWNNNINNGQVFVAESSAQYVVTGTSVDNCVATDTVELTVNALPLINAGSDIAACFGEQVTLTATGAPQVVWNNNVINGQGFVAESSAQYVVTGTSVDNCVATDTVELTVNALPLINAGSDIVACFGDQVTLTATGAPQVVWNNNVINGQGFVAESSAQYVVTGTSVDNCVATDTVELTVKALPQVNAGIDTSFCSDQFPVTISGVSNGFTFSWSTGSSTLSTVVNNPGIYILTAYLDNCIASDTIQVIEESCASLTEEKIISAVYPNPFHDKLIIFINGESCWTQLLDSQGKLISQFQLENGLNEIEAKNILPGVYYLMYKEEVYKLVK